MQIKFYATIIIALLNIYLGLWILRRNYKSPGNIYYCGLCVSGGLWALAMAWLLNLTNQTALNLDLKFTYIFGILPPFFYLLFAYHYPYKLWVYSRKLIVYIYSLTIFFVLLVAFGLFHLESSMYLNGKVEQYTIFPNFLIFGLYFFFYIIWGLVILFLKLRKIEGFYRTNVKYLVIATLSTFFLTGIMCVIMPIFGNFTLDWLGPIFTLVHFTIVGYLLFYKVNKN